MNKVVYTSNPARFSWRHVLPWLIAKDLYQHRLLITSITIRDFRAAYQASYLGLSWQIILPLIMLSIFYLVFGEILGGRFLNNGVEKPIDFALALFVGLGYFNFFVQNLGTSTSLIAANTAYVKTLSFPLEILPVIAVLTSLINLVIAMLLTVAALLIFKGGLHASALLVPLYLLFIFLMALGVSYALSALAVFLRDVAAVVSPITLILMFMCPIFYPASMVPPKIRWVIEWNPLAVIIEDVRGCLLYGVWPGIESVVGIGLVSTSVAVMGYLFFMRAKSAFADVM